MLKVLALLQFNTIVSEQLFVVILHPDNLGILSANAPVETDEVYEYDFSISERRLDWI